MLSFYLFYIKKFFSILNKVLLVLTVYFLIFFLFSSFTQKKPVNNLKTEEQLITEDIAYSKKIIQEKDPTKEKYLLKAYQSTLCFSTGYECQNKKSIKENYQNSLSGVIDKVFASVFVIRPASSIYWVYNSLEKAHFIPKTYAQNQSTPGIGLASLQFIYKIWENMRNISYILIVLVLVTIGFMIMFRMKLNPQTVISVENALPKIVIALILITFSYPIGGLMIDLVYISLPIIKDVFINIIPQNQLEHTFSQFTEKFNVPLSIAFDVKHFDMYFAAYNSVFGGGILGAHGVLSFILTVIFNIFVFVIGVLFINPVANFVLDILGDGELGIAGFLNIKLVRIIVRILLLVFIIYGIPFFIVFFGILFLGFRIFFTLLSCLINLIVYIILAPLYLLLEAVPGKSSFSSWIKNILGNLIVFPGFLFLIYLSRALYYNIKTNTNAFSLPGFSMGVNVGSWDTGLTFQMNALASIIGVFIFLMIPDLLKVLKQTIIGKEGLNLPTSPGVLFGSVSTIGSTTMGFANQLYYLRTGYDAITGKKNVPGEEGKLTTAGQRELPKNVLERAKRIIEAAKV